MTNKSRLTAWQQAIPIIRDMVVLAIGAVGVLTELIAWLVLSRSPDPSLLVLFTAALGLPIFLHKDSQG